LIAGVLGEKVFEPAMADGGFLADSFGWLVGTGPGSGFSLMILFCGVGGTLVGLVGYLTPAIRNVNKTMPDYDLSISPESPGHIVTEMTPALAAPEKPLDGDD
jgi:hypothetical protein